MLQKDFAILFALLTLATNVCASSVPPKIANLIYKWGPLVKLASGEKWKPSGVDYFLAHTKMERCNNQPEPMTIYNLNRCNSNSYLTTKQRIKRPSSTEPDVLRGQNPKAVPVYVLYREQNNFLEVAYWFFFPYNRGKRVCIGYFANNVCPCAKIPGVGCTCPRVRGCVGGYSTFGHHVGDWEHVMVRFRKISSNYQIYSIFLSIHNSEVTKKFGGEFLWKDGKFRKGSQSLAMIYNTHAIVYAAEGSHGIWPTAGQHVYKELPNGDKLEDHTSKGVSWYTWRKLKVTKYDPNRQYSGEFKFLEFSGRWGNEKRGCGIAEKVGGECQLNNGPKGPAYKPWSKLE